MTCIKTGCVAYLQQYGMWIYGDAHSYGGRLGDPENSGFLVVRAVWSSRDVKSLSQFGNVRHFTVAEIADWWDESETSMNHPSTMISLSERWVNEGYDGRPDPLL